MGPRDIRCALGPVEVIPELDSITVQHHAGPACRSNCGKAVPGTAVETPQFHDNCG